MQQVKKYCKEPTATNFRNIPELFQRIINAVAEYAIDYGEGNVENAIKIHKIFTASKLTDESKRGIKAIFIALQLLKVPEFRQKKTENIQKLR